MFGAIKLVYIISANPSEIHGKDYIHMMIYLNFSYHSRTGFKYPRIVTLQILVFMLLYKVRTTEARHLDGYFNIADFGQNLTNQFERGSANEIQV